MASGSADGEDEGNKEIVARKGILRMDTVTSINGEHYAVLPPINSPGVDETDQTIAFYSGLKPFVPYMSIYGSPSRLLFGLGSSYLPKTAVTLKIPSAIHDMTYKHPLNPNLYKIEVTHGPFNWTIHKRFKHFLELHESLWRYRTSLKIPVPTKTHRQKRKTRRGMPKAESKIPKFPKAPEILVSNEELDKRRSQLELYLNSMLESKMYRNHDSTKKFLEVSRFSFIEALGSKSKEGVIKKRMGGHLIPLKFLKCCSNSSLCAKWDNRWFIIKDTFIAYLDTMANIKGVILFDSYFNIVHQPSSSKILLNSSSRELRINCWTDRQALEWKESIEFAHKNLSANFTDANIRLKSFAPLRQNCYSHWFVDGRTYMEAVADAIEGAKEEVFITDWWLSPEIYLKRPLTGSDRWRLDKVLKRKADEGVKIYVQLYKAVEAAVALGSSYTKRLLGELNSKNISVMRHPDLSASNTLLYAHHEKIVVIDQSVAFIGGLDLCYGRWDDHVHRLTDLGNMEDCEASAEDTVDSPSQKPLNQLPNSSTAMAFTMFGAMTMGVVQQVSAAEAPPPIAMNENSLSVPKSKFRNRIFRSLSTRRKERQSHTDEETPHSSEMKEQYPEKSERSPLMKLKSVVHSPKQEIQPKTGTTLFDAVQAVKKDKLKGKKKAEENYFQAYKYMQTKVQETGTSMLWVGKDYNNFIHADVLELDDPFGDAMDRRKWPRQPWHDIASVTYGKPARDAARHFIQRWNFTKVQKKKTANHVPFIIPKTYTDESFNIAKDTIHPRAVQADVQILRSSSSWSAGINHTDRSIQNAYLYAIENSKHYIYIENQFFITCRNDQQVQNSICEALFQRIVRAHKNKKKFRVYVVMPLLPGFKGDISDSSQSQAIRSVLHWQYKSINRGPNSLMESLNKEIGNGQALKYLSFCGLRTHSELQKKPVTEFIYVHSKMLIVDDRLVIIGSANINDRSMSGTRDSEVAIIVEDTNFVDSTMDSKPYQAGQYAMALRQQCFCEHLGLLPDNYDLTYDTFNPLTHPNTKDVRDVVCDYFFKDIWTKTAAINTTTYEKVFGCVPSDYVRAVSDFPKFQQNKLIHNDVDAARQELKKVKGTLVLLPLLFLCDEDLTPDALTKEGIAPTDLWT